MSHALQRIAFYDQALTNQHDIINGAFEGSPPWVPDIGFTKFGLQDSQTSQTNYSSNLSIAGGCNVTSEPYFMTWDQRFSFARRLPVSCTDFAREFDSHIIILAVTQGWAIARQRFLLDQQWNAIETSDAELVRYCSFAERFAFLWILRSNLKALSQVRLKYRQQPINPELTASSGYWEARASIAMKSPTPI